MSLRVRLLEGNREFLPPPPPLEKMEEGKKNTLKCDKNSGTTVDCPKLVPNEYIFFEVRRIIVVLCAIRLK